MITSSHKSSSVPGSGRAYAHINSFPVNRIAAESGVINDQRRVYDRYALGITPQGIAAARIQRCPQIVGKVHLANIIKHKDAILESRPGVYMFRARTVLLWLKARGLGLTGKGQKLCFAAVIGNVLGREGLALPSIRLRRNVRYFALRMIGASVEEKRALQLRLDALTSDERAALPVA